VDFISQTILTTKLIYIPALGSKHNAAGISPVYNSCNVVNVGRNYSHRLHTSCSEGGSLY